MNHSSPDRLETDPVIAWRRWYAYQKDGDLRLVSPVLPYVWPAGSRAEARCAQHNYDAPAVDCACGFYAVKSRADIPLRHPTTMVSTVIGTVSLWGRVIEHKLGYRAQYAYPYALEVESFGGIEQDTVAAKLTSRYGVDARSVNPPPVWAGRRTILT